MGDSDKNTALFFVPDGRKKRLMMVNKKHTISTLKTTNILILKVIYQC